MSMTLICAGCQQAMQIEEKFRGLTMRCPRCAQLVEVPGEEKAPSPPELESEPPRVAKSKLGLPLAALMFGLLGFATNRFLGLLGIFLGLAVLSGIRRNPALRKGRGLAVAGVVFGAVNFLLIDALGLGNGLRPVLARAREYSKRTACADHLRAIHDALLSHAAKNGGRYPPSLDELVREGNIKPGLMRCAHVEADIAAATYRYWPPPTTGCKEGTVLLLEDPANHLDEGGHALVCGGEVRFLSANEWRRLVGNSRK